MRAPGVNIANLLASGPLALAGIITHSGSAPRTSGAQMLVLPDGSIMGSIGGGRYEAKTITAAQDIIKKGGDALCLHFSLSQTGDMDMICGGNILVLVEHISPSKQNREFFAAVQRAREADKPFVLARLLDFTEGDLLAPKPDAKPATGRVTRHLLPKGASLAQAGLPAALEPLIAEAWLAQAPFIKVISGQSWLLEAFLPPERVHIIGGGHVSLALARLAEATGFSSSVLDDRAEFANATRFPASKVVCPPSLAEAHMDEYFAAARPGGRDAVVIVTRGHAFDRDALAAALRTGAGYIGMIGSGPKRKQVYDSLLSSGFGQGDLDRVHSPIGLAINAQTPEEIAVSIMAELILWRRGGVK